MKREDLQLNKTKRNDSSDQIYVFFPEEAKVGVKTMKIYTNRMKSENFFRAVLVVQQNLTPFARTCISEISSKFHLEVFQEVELLVNIKEHVRYAIGYGVGSSSPLSPSFNFCLELARNKPLFPRAQVIMLFKMSQILHKIGQYLPLLENLIFHVDLVSSNLQIAQWTSNLKM
ncbi:hypothetical protein UlMin_005531 [Ulmus minor]